MIGCDIFNSMTICPHCRSTVLNLSKLGPKYPCRHLPNLNFMYEGQVCFECDNYYETKYPEVLVDSCEFCGELRYYTNSRFSRKAAIKSRKEKLPHAYWTAYGVPESVKMAIRISTCKKIECIIQYKENRELRNKYEQVKLAQKEFKDEIKQLKQAIKGD